jgi:hypothetical protein
LAARCRLTPRRRPDRVTSRLRVTGTSPAFAVVCLGEFLVDAGAGCTRLSGLQVKAETPVLVATGRSGVTVRCVGQRLRMTFNALVSAARAKVS